MYKRQNRSSLPPNTPRPWPSALRTTGSPLLHLANASTLTPTTTGPAPSAMKFGSTGMTIAGGWTMRPGGLSAHPLRRPSLQRSTLRDHLVSASTGKPMSTGPALTVTMSGGTGTMPAPSGGVTSAKPPRLTCSIFSQWLIDHQESASTGTPTTTLPEPTATMFGPNGTIDAASGGCLLYTSDAADE